MRREKSFIPFRQLGQYEDEELDGLYYNRFRYYDCNIGSYISQDPIGLEGNNPNFYGYTHNSNSFVDIFGLNECIVTSRNGSFNEAKRDAGIPKSQQPDKIFDQSTNSSRQYRKIPMTDRNVTAMLGNDGRPIMTREYQFTKSDGSKVIIQDYAAGHSYPNGVGNQGPHINVRPIENVRTGKVPGTKPHYPFKK